MVHKLKQYHQVEEAARSEALSLLILDEAAFIDKIDEIWTAHNLHLTTGGNVLHYQHLMVWVIGFTKLG